MTSISMRALIAAFFVPLCLVSLLVAPARGDAQGDPSAYDALVRDAVLEYEHGNYAEARALFRRAHQLRPNARTLRGMGMAAFEVRDYPAALRNLRAALRSERRPLTEEQRRQVEGLVRRSEAFVDRITLEGLPAGATVSLDGAASEPDEEGAILVGLGRHELVVVTRAGTRRQLALVVRGGNEQALRVGELFAQDASPAPTEDRTLDPHPESAATAEERGIPGRAIFALSLGGALAAGAVGAGLWWRERNQAIDECAAASSSCSNGDQLDRQRAGAVATTAILAAGSFSLTALGIVWASSPDSEQDATSTLRCAPRLLGMQCAGEF